jgi:predicted small metal-binding protein
LRWIGPAIYIYHTHQQTLLESTSNWEALKASERERVLNLLRMHKEEVSKRQSVSENKIESLEQKISTLYDREQRRTNYAKEYAVEQMQAERAGVPPKPRAPARPPPPKMTADILVQLKQRERLTAGPPQMINKCPVLVDT